MAEYVVYVYPDLKIVKEQLIYKKQSLLCVVCKKCANKWYPTLEEHLVTGLCDHISSI